MFYKEALSKMANPCFENGIPLITAKMEARRCPGSLLLAITITDWNERWRDGYRDGHRCCYNMYRQV